MKDALKTRPVTKLPHKVRLKGRILFLTEDAGLVRRQALDRLLDAGEIARVEGGPVRGARERGGPA